MNSIEANSQIYQQTIKPKRPLRPQPQPKNESTFGGYNRSAEKVDEKVAPQTARGIRVPNNNLGDQKSCMVYESELDRQEFKVSGIVLSEVALSGDAAGKIPVPPRQCPEKIQKPTIQQWEEPLKQQLARLVEVENNEKLNAIMSEPKKLSIEECIENIKIKIDMSSEETLSLDADHQQQINDLLKKADKLARYANNLIKARELFVTKNPDLKEAFSVFDQVDLESMKIISRNIIKGKGKGKGKGKEIMPVFNSKLFKHQFIAISETKGLFRTNGHIQGVKALKENISKKPLTKICSKATKSMDSFEVLESPAVLASYAKQELREKYCIRGSSKASYMDVFNRLQEKDKIVLIDLLDAIHCFCSGLPKKSNTGLSLEDESVDVALGPSLYGIEMPNQANPDEKPKSNGSVKEFLKQWPLAKGEMMELMKK